MILKSMKIEADVRYTILDIQCWSSVSLSCYSVDCNEIRLGKSHLIMPNSREPHTREPMSTI